MSETKPSMGLDAAEFEIARLRARADALDAALVAVRQEPSWQPIETAPGGGWHFLAWCPHNRCTYIAANGGKEWYTDGEWRPAAEVMAMFTHWRPLPPSPEPAAPAPSAAEEPR